MQAAIKGSTAFQYLDLNLDPGDSIWVESDGMASMDVGLVPEPRFNGGFISGILKKFLGGESLFVNNFVNRSEASQHLTLTNPLPGDVVQFSLEDSSLCFQPGAFIAATQGVHLGLKWAGLPFLLAREGLFKLEVEGTGTVWFGAFGSIREETLNGEMVVDSGHLVAFDSHIKIKGQLAAGLLGSFLSGEGFVIRLEGEGKVYTQTRSVGGLVGWLNTRI